MLNLIGWGNWNRTSGMPESKSGALPLGYTPRSMVGRDGFEPPNHKELSYSQPRLASSLPPQHFFIKMVPTRGIEPPTY